MCVCVCMRACVCVCDSGHLSLVYEEGEHEADVSHHSMWTNIQYMYIWKWLNQVGCVYSAELGRYHHFGRRH